MTLKEQHKIYGAGDVSTRKIAASVSSARDSFDVAISEARAAASMAVYTYFGNKGTYEECPLLRCNAAWVLLEPTFRRNVSPPSSGR
jgi:hypothetical protein